MTNFSAGPYLGHEAAGTLQDAQSADSNGTPLSVVGCTVAILQVEGAFSGVVLFEGTQDGQNWAALRGINMRSGESAEQAAGEGIFALYCAGLVEVRARTDGFGGTVTVTGRATAADLPVSAGVSEASILQMIEQGAIPDLLGAILLELRQIRLVVELAAGA